MLERAPGFSAARGRDLLTHLVKSRKITMISTSAIGSHDTASGRSDPKAAVPSPVGDFRENYFIKKKKIKKLSPTRPQVPGPPGKTGVMGLLCPWPRA